ncbi:MAG: SIMPL domain-containing protein [Bacteroidota bacterium]|nr:SIMPL domain-containing protein [Bacteroidota bacterium]
MKSIIISAFVVFLFSPAIFAQAGGNLLYQENNRYIQNKNYKANQEAVWNNRNDNIEQNSVFNSSKDNEILFTVNVLMNKKADSYMAIFNITQNAKTAKEVDEIVNKKINGFKTNLEKLGIGKEDIFTDMISLVPVYSYQIEKRLFSKTYTEIPSGFEMQKNIHLRFSDENLLDNIMTAAAENEVYDFIKLEYFVKDSEKIYSDMRTSAIENMKKKTEAFKQIGINADTIYHTLSEQTSVVYPIDRYRSYKAFTSTAINPGKFDDTEKIRKPKTMFYNMLPYYKYDIVINPEILEPAVQYTYSLRVKYIFNQTPNEKKTKYFMLTPEGILKYIELK